MASAGDPYLPDLAKFLAREENVFSWQSVSLDLRNIELNTRNIIILTSSSTAQKILSQPVPSFSGPSQQSRGIFETRTAAINVTPTAEKSHDITEVKNDTLWLSGELKLSEEESLRTVMLEWESRSKQRLLAGYSEAELASLKDSLNVQMDGDTGERLEQAFIERSDTKFDAEQARRERILMTYFQEQSGLLSVANELLQVTIPGNNKRDGLTQAIDHLSKILHQTITSDENTEKVLQAIESRLHALEAGKSWSIYSETVNQFWIAFELRNVSLMLDGLLLRLHSMTEDIQPSQTIIHWLRIASGCEFFASLEATEYFSGEQVEHLQTNTSLVSLAFLSSAAAVTSLADNKSKLLNHNAYYLSSDIATEIHNIMFTAAEDCVPQVAPVALAWAMILSEIQNAASRAKDQRDEQRAIEQPPNVETYSGRRNSYGSLQQSVYEDIIDHINNSSPVSDPVAYLSRCTIEAGRALEVAASSAVLNQNCPGLLGSVKLEILQDWVIVCVSTLGYTSELLHTQFALLVASTPSQGSSYSSNLAEAFIRSDFLMDNMYAVAAARFPYESLPFLRLCKHLAKANIFDEHGTQYVTYRLRNMETFTWPAYGPFASYRTVREDENLNLVTLDDSCSIVGTSQHNLINYGDDQASSTIIPAGTIGEVISEASPPIIRWQHSFSGLSLLGLWLKLHYRGQLQSILSPFENAEDVVTEVIDLLSTLLASSLKDDDGVAHGSNRTFLQDAFFQETQANLENDSNIADFIFEIAEQELQSFRRRPTNTFNTSLLIACIDFMSIFIKIRPTQFWTYMNKSSLLGLHGTDSILITIVSGVEAPDHCFMFLESCSRLYEVLIEACLMSSSSLSLQQKSSSTKPLYPQNLRIQASVLTSLTRSLYAAFEMIPAWTFITVDQHLKIIKILSESFTKVVLYARSVGEVASKLNMCFLPSCEILANETRPYQEDNVGATSIVRNLLRNTELRGWKNLMANSSETNVYFAPLLKFAHAIVRVGSKSSAPPSSLELQLFNAVPLLVRVLSIERVSTRVAFGLLGDLIDTVAPSEPVSLLGHLGSVSSLCLLDLLEDQQIGGDIILEVATWRLLTKLVGRNQQWLALIILTGDPPENGKGTKDKPTKGFRGRVFMSSVLDRLAKIAHLPQQLAVVMLEFVIEAQENWSWTTNALQTKKDLWPAIVSYVTDVYVDPSAALQLAYRNKIAALITDLATTHLHHARVMQNNEHAKVTLSLLQWLAKNAVEVGSYNSSLHANLRRNFATKFGSLDMLNFKRTGLTDTTYGDQYYYDLDYANIVLHTEQYWTRQGGSQDQSFLSEFRRANINLSIVDSEMTLLRSLQGFCIEHCGWVAAQSKGLDTNTDKTYHEVLIQIVENCLRTNAQDYPSQKIFENLFQTRADLTIVVLQQLNAVQVRGFEIKALLKLAWTCATSRNGSYEKAMANDDMTCWRSMLTVVLLALQFHVGGKWLPPVADHSNSNLLRYTLNDQIPTVLDIITVVIGQGLRSVVGGIQEQKRSSATADSAVVTAKDISLILTILETILQMSRLTEFASEASGRLISSGAIQSCLLLYSWSHTQIRPQSHDEPLYADGCLQFLSTLSSLPLVTEEMAIEGLLSRLLNARMTQALQNVPDGAGHLDTRPHCQILYHLWATGILPICLNLLHSVGAPIAAEVSVFLNQFPKQLDRASTAFIPGVQSKSSDSNAITLAAANEATTLALISFILSSYRNAGASAAIDPTTIMPLIGYDEHKKALREDISDIVNQNMGNLKASIVPTTEKETIMAKARNADVDELTKKVQQELKNTLVCLDGQDTEEDDKQ